MEIKYNEATINRPAGDRILDAATVFMDIPSYIRQLHQEEAWMTGDRNSLTILKTELVTIVLMCLHSGAVIENNSIDGLITLQVINGAVSIELSTGSSQLVKGEMIAIHKFVQHSVRALEESVLLLTNNCLDTQQF